MSLKPVYKSGRPTDTGIVRRDTYNDVEEPIPNGDIINMGAFGGTPQASMSLSDTGNSADLN